MPIYVTPEDNDLAKKLFTSYIDKIDSLNKYRFAFNKDLTALFDFSGYKKVIEVEVKVRDCKSTAFADYYISVEKAERVKTHPQYEHFIIYFFKGDKLAKVFKLNDLELTDGVSNYHEPIGDIDKSVPVKCVPADKFIFSFPFEL